MDSEYLLYFKGLAARKYNWFVIDCFGLGFLI